MTLSPVSTSPIFLGIDTGGTYTDAVLWSAASGLIAKAKSLTTRHDLAVGIAGAVDAVLAASRVDGHAIKLVSMSTTLATNALVEGQGERSALVMIGFGQAELARHGLKEALGSDPVVFVPGGHDVFGSPSPLLTEDLEAQLPELAASVSGFAVCGQFAVRNPEHEIAVGQLLRARTGLPVTTSHELSAKLGGPRRALTTLFNARLISMIDRLVAATEDFLQRRSIVAPLMVVRGDGSLISSAFARARPIETILSGPAASLVGARHLTGFDDAVISDIGGTTTDVAILRDGRPRLDPEGASIGGFRTMVEAVAVRTFGLGGDSEVALDGHGLAPELKLGPRRLVPLALAAVAHREAILSVLDRQIAASMPTQFEGRFAIRTGVPERLAAGLAAPEARLFGEISDVPQPLDRLLSASADRARLDRLVARGLVQIIGFTPSDAAHALGRQMTWEPAASRLGAALFARKRDGRGLPIAVSGEALAERVLTRLQRRSAEALLETAFAEDGLDAVAMVAHPLVQRSLDGLSGVATVAVGLDRPVIGLGASAPLHYAGLDRLVGNRCVVPDDTDVANALGAVVGQVRIAVEATISQPVEGVFRLTVGEGVQNFRSEDEALSAAETAVHRIALEQAVAAGTDTAEIEIGRQFKTAEVEGRRMLISVEVIAVAAGRPRIAD